MGHGAKRVIVNEGISGHLLFVYTKSVFAIDDGYIEVKIVDIGSSIFHREFDRRVIRIQVVDEIL